MVSFDLDERPPVRERPRRREGSRIGPVVAVAVVAALALLITTGRLADLFPSLPNPFGTEKVDRSQPALLESLHDLSAYHAASANFQVIVDTETDASFLPSAIRGERTVFVTAGSVDAAVDFSGLDEGAIRVSDDRRSVTVSLLAPTLSEPRVDPEQSRVVSRDRGLLDRLGSVFSDSPTSDQELYLAAEGKMRAAAAGSDLRARAEQNTRQMLETMLRTLGFTEITVSFAPNPA
ncbi:MAG TPA: DUF4230 domain-containing protein [Acidimicrobiales bacterium]|nr:DUF4230 domain-containing protein [Acidimicrobiales bacterium]